MSYKPKIGVSQCLLGKAVRYDATSKPNRIVIEELSKLFEFVPVCPEVEAGLSIPRPPVQLTGDLAHPRLTGRDDPALDVTDLILKYCRQKPESLGDLCGFIFKSRSPSCGLNSTPVLIENKIVTENSRGVFARALCEAWPGLPVIEETALESEFARLAFIDAVQHYKPRSDSDSI